MSMRHRLLKLVTMVVCLFCMGVWQSAGRNPIPTGSPDSAIPLPEEEEPLRMSKPDSIRYERFYAGGSTISDIYAYISPFPFTEDLYVRFQLLDDTENPGSFTYKVVNGDTHSEVTIPLDEDKGFWYPQEFINQGNGGVTISVETWTSGTLGYSLRVYSSQSLEGEPLISAENRHIYFLNEDQFPSFSWRGSTNRLSGALGQDIPFTLEVTPGFMLNQEAKIEINVRTDDWENQDPSHVVISGNNIQKDPDPYNTCYICSLSSLEATNYTFQVRADQDFSGWLDCRLLDKDGNFLDNYSNISVVIPIYYSEEDVAALKKMADDNPLSTDLRRFIDNEYYLKDFSDEDGYRVGVKWSQEQQNRVNEFMLDDYEARVENLETLNTLTELTQIRLNGTCLEGLNLSALSQLRFLSLWDTPLFWDDVILPLSPMDDLWLSGNTRISIGTPLDDNSSVAANGTEIDLSEFAVVDGQNSTYQWYQEEEYSEPKKVEMPTVGEEMGKFLLQGTPGARYYCEIKNPLYDDWAIETSRCKITRNSDQYAQADIDGLKKLAESNPQVPQLQEFVDSKGWELDNWESGQDVIRTEWSSGETARLTHLLIELDWGEEPDTISSLDLSAFTELKYFECERFMNIAELDLSKNTKLEELYLYSRNLKEIDLSSCPNLKQFRFGTQYTNETPSREYLQTVLTRLNLDGCIQLEGLYLEHAHITSLDLSPFKQLRRLHIENCQDLPVINGFEQASQLYSLELPSTTQFQDLINNLPSNVTELLLQDTQYTLPPAEKLARLYTLGLPSYIESLDLAKLPNLQNLDLGWRNDSKLRYSQINNYRPINYNGTSFIQLKSPSHPNEPEWFENGDTIDLSSEAVINGVETVFLWVNEKYNTEEKNALVPVDGKPGVFVLNSLEEEYGSYRCKLMNPQFCEITEINHYWGWQIDAGHIHVETGRESVFDPRDVDILARIVSESSSEALKEWFSSGEWQTGKNSDHAQAIWNDETPRRLTELYIYMLGGNLSGTIDLEGLDKLEQVSLTGNRVEQVILPSETGTLKSLMLGDNPTLTSLIVSPYTNLEHLDIRNTGLTACDVSNNVNLKELYLQGTNLPSVETSTPAIAQNLTEYGAPETVETIDFNNFPALTTFIPNGCITFSDVQNPRQMDPITTYIQYMPQGSVRNAYTPYGTTLDYSAEGTIGQTTSTIVWKMADQMEDEGTTIEHSGFTYTISDTDEPNKVLSANFENTLFPGWTIRFYTTIYTCDGDANLDKEVNVQDIPATVSYILQDTENIPANFGWAEADVNYDDKIQVADVTGIVNLIQGKPLTRASQLRSEYAPTVLLELDDNGFLSITSPVSVAGLQLEFTGAKEELPFIGEAAKFVQASTLHSDTLRTLGYSMDGKVIPANKKTVIMQLPAGVRLESALFSDTKATALRSEGDMLPTGNEAIQPISQVTSILNYPNPFRGSTTFRYTLKERASAVTIQIYSATGALVRTLSGLPGDAGLNQYTASLSLPSGTYIYRLSVCGNNNQTISKSNILISK